MRKWTGFLLGVVAASMLAVWLMGRFTFGSVLGWAVMLAALIGPMYLAPERYAEWTRRCHRFLGFNSSPEHRNER